MAGKEAWNLISSRIKFVLKVHEGKLKDNGDKVLPKKWMDAFLGKNASHWPSSCIDLLRTIDLTNRKKEDSARLKTILFLKCLIRFSEVCGSSIKDNKELRGSFSYLKKTTGIPESILLRFLHLFTFDANTGEPGGGEETAVHDPDMRLSYRWDRRRVERRNLFALVAYASAAGGKDMRVSDITGIMKDLKLDGTQARKVLSQAGFLSKVNGDGSISAVLKVPLTFPTNKRAKR